MPIKKKTTNTRVIVTTTGGARFSIGKKYLRQVDTGGSLLYRLNLYELKSAVARAVPGEYARVNYTFVATAYGKRMGYTGGGDYSASVSYDGDRGATLYIGCQGFDAKAAKKIVAAARRATKPATK